MLEAIKRWQQLDILARPLHCFNRRLVYLNDVIMQWRGPMVSLDAGVFLDGRSAGCRVTIMFLTQNTFDHFLWHCGYNHRILRKTVAELNSANFSWIYFPSFGSQRRVRGEDTRSLHERSCPRQILQANFAKPAAERPYMWHCRVTVVATCCFN